MNATDILKHR